MKKFMMLWMLVFWVCLDEPGWIGDYYVKINVKEVHTRVDGDYVVFYTGPTLMDGEKELARFQKKYFRYYSTDKHEEKP